MSMFDVNDQSTPEPVNKPSSGTYGEGVALENLKRQLPITDGTAPAISPTPPMPGIAPPTPSAPGPLPPAMFGPTQRPGVPVSTPMAQPPVNPVTASQTSRQRNLAVLDALVQDPNVSEVTRSWAENLIAHLVQGSRR